MHITARYTEPTHPQRKWKQWESKEHQYYYFSLTRRRIDEIILEAGRLPGAPQSAHRLLSGCFISSSKIFLFRSRFAILLQSRGLFSYDIESRGRNQTWCSVTHVAKCGWQNVHVRTGTWDAEVLDVRTKSRRAPQSSGARPAVLSETIAFCCSRWFFFFLSMSTSVHWAFLPLVQRWKSAKNQSTYKADASCFDSKHKFMLCKPGKHNLQITAMRLLNHLVVLSLYFVTTKNQPWKICTYLRQKKKS